MAFFAQEIVLSPWTSLSWLAMQQILLIKGISICSLKTLFLTASIFNTEVSQLRSHICLVGSAIPDISLLRQLVPYSAVHARQALVLFTYLSIQRSLIPPPPPPAAKDTQHPGQRRSPNKIVGGAQLHLKSNPCQRFLEDANETL